MKWLIFGLLTEHLKISGKFFVKTRFKIIKYLALCRLYIFLFLFNYCIFASLCTNLQPIRFYVHNRCLPFCSISNSWNKTWFKLMQLEIAETFIYDSKKIYIYIGISHVCLRIYLASPPMFSIPIYGQTDKL